MAASPDAELRLSHESSRRITMLRFPLIYGVILIHAYGLAVKFSHSSISSASWPVLLAQTLISQVLARTAVPLFFLISGMLFFLHYDASSAWYRRQLSSRVGSLLVPYLFWNAAVLLLMCVLQSLPMLSVFFSGRGESVTTFGLFDSLNALLGLTHDPIADHFWFIRDLMLLALAVPLVASISLRVPRLSLALYTAIWLANKHLRPFGVISFDAILFFSAGAVISLHRWKPERLDAYWKPITVGYLTMALLDAVILARATPPQGLQSSYDGRFHLLTILLGMAWVWVAAGQACRRPWMESLMAKLAPLSFFVFAAHELLLEGLKKLGYKILAPASFAEAILVYLAAPGGDGRHHARGRRRVANALARRLPCGHGPALRVDPVRRPARPSFSRGIA